MKKEISRIAAVFFAAALVFFAAYSPAAGGTNDEGSETVGGVTYTYGTAPSEESGGGTDAYIISADTNGLTECRVPGELGGFPVAGFSERVFEGNTEIRKIELAPCIRSIPQGSFDGCTSLEELDLSMLESIEPKNTGGLISGSPGTMPALKSIKVSEGNPAYKVCDGVLIKKDGMKIICYPAADPRRRYEMPPAVRNVTAGAFDCAGNLEEIRLSAGFQPQERTDVFGCDSLRTIDVGMMEKDLRIYNDRLIRAQGITEYKADSANRMYTVRDGVLFTGDMRELVAYPGGRDDAVYTVPEGVTRLSGHAFAGSRAEEIILPKSLTVIAEYAFENSRNLAGMVIPNNVRLLGAHSFIGCGSLKYVTIPPHTTNIDEQPELNAAGAVIRGEEGSYAQQWAEGCGLPFEPVAIEKYDQSIDCEAAAGMLELTYGKGGAVLSPMAQTKIGFEVQGPEVVSVTDKGDGTLSAVPLKAGTAKLILKAEESDAFKAARAEVTIRVAKAKQTVTVSEEELSGKCGSGEPLRAKAKTGLTYRSSDTRVAKVSSSGTVRFIRPGKATITIRAAETDRYEGAEKKVRVRAGLNRPAIGAVTKKGQAKLSWSRVKGAEQIQLYVKYPGRSRYVRVMTRSASLKSVTHKGMKKGKVYRYKVRVRARTGGRAGGKYVYSRFSEVIRVRAR